MIGKGRGEAALRALRLRSRKRSEDRRLLDGIFGDGDKLYLTVMYLESEYPVGSDTDSGTDGSFQSFMEWLLENYESIIVMIKAFMEAFFQSEV